LAPEATAWLQVIYTPSQESPISVSAPALGVGPVDLGGHSSNSGLPMDSYGPSPVKPGAADVTVGSITLPLDFPAGQTTRVLVYGDPAAPTVTLVPDENVGQVFHANTAFGAVAISAETDDGEVPMLDSLEPGTWGELDLPADTNALLLDADLDGAPEWRMYGPMLEPATMVVYGTADAAALLHFGDSDWLWHIGTWL
jgi:hypothetical protein